jgi:predicted transcriptional regulator
VKIRRDATGARIIALSTTTLTVRLSPEVKDRLDLLAERTRRTQSYLAGEAIATYVAHELAVIEASRKAWTMCAPAESLRTSKS